METKNNYLKGTPIGYLREAVSTKGTSYFKGSLDNGTKITVIRNYAKKRPDDPDFLIMTYAQNDLGQGNSDSKPGTGVTSPVEVEDAKFGYGRIR